MVKIEVISEAQALVETTKGPAGVRLKEAMAALGGMGFGEALRVETEEGQANVYKVAFQKAVAAAAAMGLKVRLRLVGNVLYVMHEHGQQDEEEPPQEGQIEIPGPNPRGSLGSALLSSERADEAWARTKTDLDAVLGGTDAKGCRWYEQPHEHDAEGVCILPEKSDG